MNRLINYKPRSWMRSRD